MFEPLFSSSFPVVFFAVDDGTARMTSKTTEQDPPVELPPAGRGYKVYKRRFWGLLQLVLLNIVVSWDVRVHVHTHALTSFTYLVSTDKNMMDGVVVDLLFHLDHSLRAFWGL